MAKKKIPGSSMGFFLEGEDSHRDHDLGGLVELRFKAPPGTQYPYITIHLIGTTYLRFMGIQTSEVGSISATTGRGDHEVHDGHVVALKKLIEDQIYIYEYSHLLRGLCPSGFFTKTLYLTSPLTPCVLYATLIPFFFFDQLNDW
jgi:hypothetical protein